MDTVITLSYSLVVIRIFLYLFVTIFLYRMGEKFEIFALIFLGSACCYIALLLSDLIIKALKG